jgi:hypothetical protein
MPAIEAATLPSASTSEDRYRGYQHRVGSMVAALAGTIAYALWERSEGAISEAVKRRACELICELLQFKMALGEFDDVARQHGRQVLREYCAVNAVPLSETAGDDLIKQALALVTKVVRTKSN